MLFKGKEPMLNIIIPDNNIPEREYIIGMIFNNYLGLPYKLTAGIENLHYSVRFDNCELVIKDFFFCLYPDSLSYLTSDAIPEKIAYVKNEFSVEKDIPVIYGSDEFSVSENRIICGIDIFASSFFMLTRWEEYVNQTRDSHVRFPGKESVACKNSFLHRPVVNEYVELLWGMLLKLGFKGERKERTFNLVLTHDVDHLDYPATYRILFADILKRRNLKLAGYHLSQYRKSGSNPYDYFDFLMTKSEKLGLKSHFYFMASNSGLPQDPGLYTRSKRFTCKIDEIRRRGHIIGFHPGYYTFNDPERWQAEKQLLENAVHHEIVEGRQHYLRFDIAQTFRIWDQNKMETDSTLGYADNEGFRCGTGDTFPVFDFPERTRIRVKERPLIIMDGTLKQYKLYSKEKMVERFRYYMLVGKKYNTDITLLFHNSSFYGEWEGYSHLYGLMLDT
jgi:hypothetical protein